MSLALWHGVYPAVTTQFTQDGSLDVQGTVDNIHTLVDAGVHGIVLMGTTGENYALTLQETFARIQ